MNSEPKKTVSLVLGSGGARGLAHIGVIRWLEEHGYQIASISGCSMGALVGGVHAAPTFRDQTDMTIAVDAAGPVDNQLSGLANSPVLSPEASPIRARLQGFVTQMKDSLGGSGKQQWAAFDVVNDAFDAMQSTIARLKIAASPPDKVIVIPKNRCKMLEFHRADELIEFGYQQAEQTMA